MPLQIILNTNQVASNIAITSGVINSVSSPVGTVVPYVSGTAPTGWLYCNGASLSRSSYSALFAVIGTAYGTADGNSFNLPDFRGRFLRGWSDGSSTDPDRTGRTAMATGGATGNNIGSVQGDVMQGHYHYYQKGNLAGSAVATSVFGSGYGGDVPNYNDAAVNSPSADPSNGTPRTSSETRPKNAYIMYIIKYQ